MKPFPVVLDNALRLQVDALPPGALEALQAAFTHENPKRAAMKRARIPGWWAEKEQEQTWAIRRRRGGAVLELPRGGTARVRGVLAEHGLEPEWDDRRTEGDWDLAGKFPPHQRELRAFQAAAVPVACQRQQGIIRAPTGAGKSVLGFAIAAKLQLPTLVLVNTRELLEQWMDRAGAEFGWKPSQVGVVQGSRREIKPLTVAMQQSLYKQGIDDDLKGAFGTLIYDEVQLAAASTYYDVVHAFPAKYRLGISADNRRKDGKEYLNLDLFGDVIFEVARNDLEDAGVVLDVEIVMVPTEFRADWYGTEYGQTPDFQRLNAEMMADESRNELAANIVRDHMQGERVFVMARLREHCQRLAAAVVARGQNAGFLIGGEDYRSEFAATKAGMQRGSCLVGVGTVQSIGTGIDFPDVGRAVVVTPIASNRQLLQQVRGRVCRTAKGKARAELWILWDRHCGFGRRHLQNVVQWNRRVSVMTPGGRVAGADFLKTLPKGRRDVD